MSYEQVFAEPMPRASSPIPHGMPVLPRPMRAQAPGMPHDLLLAVLDEVGHALALLDADGRVCWANRLAQRYFQRCGTLALQGQHLVADSATDAQAMQRALAAACHGRRVMIRIGRGDAGTMLALVPMAPTDPHQLPCALMVLGRREACEPLSLQFFASTYQLTPAEAGVLDALGRGQSPSQVAANGRVALSTVRSHISSVRQKTGARSIAHLVRMVAGLPPLVATVDDRVTSD